SAWTWPGAAPGSPPPPGRCATGRPLPICDGARDTSGPHPPGRATQRKAGWDVGPSPLPDRSKSVLEVGREADEHVTAERIVELGIGVAVAERRRRNAEAVGVEQRRDRIQQVV